MQKIHPLAFDAEATAYLLLPGPEQDIEKALFDINTHLRDPLCGWLRSRYHLPSARDLADCWQETLVAVLTAARSGKFDLKGSLKGYLRQILQRRFIDEYRATPKWVRKGSGDPVEELVATDGGWSWRHATSAERNELRENVWAAIAQLPVEHRAIARAYCQVILAGIRANYEETRRIASIECGKVLTAAEVKIALQSVRPAIARFLKRKSGS